MLVVSQARRRAAAVAGLAGGLLPDADIFIRSANDPLMGVEYHRHFTHSFLFQPVIAILAATIAWVLLRRRVAWSSLLLPGFAAGVSHILCDAWTSYGTRLWWPFSDARVAWDMVSIIDPLVTLPLLICVIIALFRPQGKALRVGFGILLFYLGLSLVQRERASAAVRELAESRGHAIERLTVKPSFANIVVWRGIYLYDGHYHAAAVRPGFGQPTVLAGESIKAFDLAVMETQLDSGSRLAKDMARFIHFSDGWVAEVAAPDSSTRVLGDIRYSMLPQRMAPLWGIGVNPHQPDQPSPWMTFRRLMKRDGEGLWNLVQGLPEQTE